MAESNVLFSTTTIQVIVLASELTGGEPVTTNNRMEVQAAISALVDLKEPCGLAIFIASEYLRQGIMEWLPRWKPQSNPCGTSASGYAPVPF